MKKEPEDGNGPDKLDEIMSGGEPAQAVTFQEWLYGDASNLSPTARRLRLMMLNSRSFRATVFRGEGMDPEEEFAKLSEESERPGKPD